VRASGSAAGSAGRPHFDYSRSCYLQFFGEVLLECHHSNNSLYLSLNAANASDLEKERPAHFRRSPLYKQRPGASDQQRCALSPVGNVMLITNIQFGSL
ncbi:MAG: hypothetical protein WA728_14305, partial [Xanthobacteraceae bacterium]